MKLRLFGTVGACTFTLITMSANAAFIGRLPATPDGSDYQAYYDDQLKITWAANANINGKTGINSFDSWQKQLDWVAGLTIDGVDGWRLPNMDVNGDGSIVDCSTTGGSQAACKDNEYGHLFYYGAGTTQWNGITPSNQSPFSNVASGPYWSGTEYNVDNAWAFRFLDVGHGQVIVGKRDGGFAWAVRDGDIGAVPVPAAVWLFGSGLLGLAGVAKTTKGCRHVTEP